jgi:hypothetical protein
MPQSVITTETLKESGEAEEALNEAITDLAFAPTPPIAGQVAAWGEKTVYAKGAYAEEEGVVYRSQEAANKENKPSEDADFAHWAPVSIAEYPLQSPTAGAYATAERTQAAYNEPPARSDALAAPGETVNPGSQIGLGV